MLRIPTLLLLLGLSALTAPALWGADRPLGEDWEVLIQEGVQRQDARLKEASVDAVVREAATLADRPTTGAAKVARLYLLARAHGKRLDPAQRDASEAQSNYQEVLRLAPRCYFALRDLGMLALAVQPPDPRGAESYLQRALTIYPGYVQALRDLARLCQSQGRHADAVVHFRRVIDLDRTDLLARAFLAASLVQLGRPEEARREVEALLKVKPGEPAFRGLLAEVELSAGREDAAIALWRQLQKEVPSSPDPLEGLLRAYVKKRQKGQTVVASDMVNAINGLWILARDPAKRAKLEEMRRALEAPPPDPNAPPDDATLLRALSAPDVNVREQALRYVAYRAEHPSLDLLKGVLARLGPEREPEARVRSGTLLVVARHGGLGTIPIARLALYDAEPDVRFAAIVALYALGSQSVDASRAATVVLGAHVGDADARVASAARTSILTLSSAQLEPLPEGTSETEAENVARWNAWWAGPSGVEVKIRALAAFALTRDRLADQVLAPYLDDPDFFVLRAAYDALRAMKDYLPPGPRAEWAKRIPAFQTDELTPENRAEKRRSLAVWLGLRPS